MSGGLESISGERAVGTPPFLRPLLPGLLIRKKPSLGSSTELDLSLSSVLSLLNASFIGHIFSQILLS